MERDGFVIAKHFVSPSPDGSDELHRSYSVVGNQDFLDNSFASIFVYKLPRCSILKGKKKSWEKCVTHIYTQEYALRSLSLGYWPFSVPITTSNAA